MTRAHTHSAAHTAGHQHELGGTRLRLAFFLTAMILVVELTGGIFSHSLALLSDAGHVFTDLGALGLAWFAAHRAARPADARNTYGYHRTGILTALVNAVTLILVVIAIAFEAIQRLRHPEVVTPWIMFAAATVGIGVNLYIARSLHAEGGENLNLRAAWLHALGDIAASAGVIIGGIIIAFTGWLYADPLISLAIAALVARGAWQLLGATLDILMEATPRDLNVAQLVRDVVRIPEVTEVHDLHIWSIAGGLRVLSAHVKVSEDRPLSRCDMLVDEIHCLLCEEYNISHTTIQIERVGCDLRDLYCALPDGEHAHAHPHGHTHEETTEDEIPARR